MSRPLTFNDRKCVLGLITTLTMLQGIQQKGFIGVTNWCS